jgi:hypothetical protein
VKPVKGSVLERYSGIKSRTIIIQRIAGVQGPCLNEALQKGTITYFETNWVSQVDKLDGFKHALSLWSDIGKATDARQTLHVMLKYLKGGAGDKDNSLRRSIVTAIFADQDNQINSMLHFKGAFELSPSTQKSTFIRVLEGYCTSLNQAASASRDALFARGHASSESDSVGRALMFGKK